MSVASFTDEKVISLIESYNDLSDPYNLGAFIKNFNDNNIKLKLLIKHINELIPYKYGLFQGVLVSEIINSFTDYEFIEKALRNPDVANVMRRDTIVSAFKRIYELIEDDASKKLKDADCVISKVMIFKSLEKKMNKETLEYIENEFSIPDKIMARLSNYVDCLDPDMPFDRKEKTLKSNYLGITSNKTVYLYDEPYDLVVLSRSDVMSAINSVASDRTFRATHKPCYQFKKPS